MPEPSFSPEQKERILSRDESIVQYRDHYSKPEQLPVEIDDIHRTTRPRFFQEMIAQQIMRDRQRYNNGEPFPKDIERSASYEIGESYEIPPVTADGSAENERSLFKDKTGLWNEDYFKKYTAETINDELMNENRHSYNHIALFAIDLNGLKALNDYYNRAAGDAYLQRIAEWLQNSETLFQLAEKGVGIGVTRARLGAGAADEFMILAKGNPSDGVEIDWEALWSKTSIQLQEEMAALEVSDIWPAEEIEKAIEKHRLRERIPDLPHGLNFRATAGFGRTTLEHVLNAGEENEERNQITRNDQNATMLQKLSGSMINVSLKYMHEEKEMTKANPLDSQEYGLGAIIKSTGR
jgi:GGDEF domain-containing protein